MGETEGKLCFVIMPFSGTESHTEEKWTEFFNEWIKPAVEGSNLGLFCERSNPTTGDVIRDIVRKLYSAEAVVAILTDQSANVFWELGVRHSLRGTNTILFTERKRDIPSDLYTTCAWHLYSLRNRKEKQRFKTKLGKWRNVWLMLIKPRTKKTKLYPTLKTMNAFINVWNT